MQSMTPGDLWPRYCDVTPSIRERYGVSNALQYLIGEKLIGFAQSAESTPEFLAELPPFCTKIRELFTKAEIESYFEQADREAMIDPDLMKGATPEEAEDLRESLESERQDGERRQWVKAMLLREGS